MFLEVGGGLVKDRGRRLDLINSLLISVLRGGMPSITHCLGARYETRVHMNPRNPQDQYLEPYLVANGQVDLGAVEGSLEHARPLPEAQLLRDVRTHLIYYVRPGNRTSARYVRSH